MTRLPRIGGDSSTWGTLLNAYLSVAHNADGSLKNYFFNVMDPAYGAVGDGIANDTVALQAPINVAQNANGRTIYLPPGIYLISAPLTSSKHAISLRGSAPRE